MNVWEERWMEEWVDRELMKDWTGEGMEGRQK